MWYLLKRLALLFSEITDGTGQFEWSQYHGHDRNHLFQLVYDDML